MQIAAVEITIDHLLDIGPPESVLPGEIFVIDLDKGLKIVLYAADFLDDKRRLSMPLDLAITSAVSSRGPSACR